MPPTNELKYYSTQINLLNRNLFKDRKRVKSDEGKKAAANLAAYSLCTDPYISNTEKESKLRKTGKFLKYQENVHDVS